MASDQIMSWKHIPSQVKAWDGDGEVKRMLPDYFQAAIDAYAMKDGSTEMDAYLDGWRWGPVEQRDGAPEDLVCRLLLEKKNDNSHTRALALRKVFATVAGDCLSTITALFIDTIA